MSVRPSLKVSNSPQHVKEYENPEIRVIPRFKFLNALADSLNRSKLELKLVNFGKPDETILKPTVSPVVPQTCTPSPEDISLNSNNTILKDVVSDQSQVNSECSPVLTESSECNDKPNTVLSKPEVVGEDLTVSTTSTEESIPTEQDVPTKRSDSFVDTESGKKYSCTVEGCKAAFFRPSKLKVHLNSHYGKKPFLCSVLGCSKAYSSMSHLNRHRLTCHDRQSHVGTPFICKIEGCGKALKTRDILTKHMNRSHSEKPFTCQICSLSFQNKQQLSDHSTKKHKGKSSHQCDECKVSFSRLGRYNRHMRKHRLHICPEPGCSYTCKIYANLRTHISTDHPKLLECYKCGKKIKDKAQLRRHCRVHLVEEGLADPLTNEPHGTYPCHSCSSVLTTKGSLKRHIYKIHEIVKVPRKVKKGDERARRWDKGLPKKSIASYLASSTVPPSLEKALLTKEEHSDLDSTSAEIVQLMLDQIKKTKEDTKSEEVLST